MSSTPDATQPALSPAEIAALLSALQVEVVGLKARTDTQQETIVNLMHENALLKRRIYGNKTERGNTEELQLTLGNLLDGDKQLQKQLDESVGKALDVTEEDEEPAPKGPRPPPKGRRDLSVSTLPRVPLDILDPALEQTSKRIGFDETLQLMYRRGGFAVLVKRTAKYEVPGIDGPTVLGVEQPKTLFPRGLLHSSVVAHVIVQKFGLGVPHHRLEQHLKAQSCELDRGTMGRYVEEAGNALGATVVHAMWQQAKRAAVISTDATSGLVQPVPNGSSLRQACKKGHFFTAVIDCDHVLFAFTEKHTQDFVKTLFSGFTGYLQADASNVYDVLEKGPPVDSDESITLVGCWAHCRRYFFEAAICKYKVGIQGLMHIRAIYAADDALKKLPPAKRKALRDEHVRPLMERFFEWVKAAKAQSAGRNLATRAIGYALNQQHELLRVLEDPRLPLDNTRSERALRKIVVGRKNWMFYGSDTHAEAAAALFSLIATCRLHRVDVEQYLDEVLRLLPYWPTDRFIELAPDHWVVTRAKLDPAQLALPLAAFTIPAA
ncbi:MAG TPA: IS66 family transposase [Polyangiaceae bacterium]|nr:IS66 family transposase [Polyangiaceae bacterium]